MHMLIKTTISLEDVQIETKTVYKNPHLKCSSVLRPIVITEY